ncbi:MAG: AAA family ATPase, partial [Ruminococcus sp.]
SEVIYFDRSEVPISSTEIRDWATTHWDYIPDVCKPYYAKKVLIIGSESTGKSTLVQNLALAFNTNFVSEVGRDTCEYAGGEEFMNVDDLYENLIRQKLNMMDALKHTNRVLFVDTDSITTLFYSHFLLSEQKEIENCTKLAEAINAINDWDLVLFLEPTVAFVQDGTRSEEIASDREKYSQQIKDLLDKNKVTYFCISGNYYERFVQAKKLLEQIGLTTIW